jgi:transcriptional regulator with XRE-family HTH domain
MNNYFAKNLKYIRKKKNIDQQVMAEDLGVAQSTLSCWESGIRTPDLDMIVKITKYLNISEDFITKDLTCSNNDYNELDNLLFSKAKALNDDEKQAVLQVINAIHKDIDKELDK